MNKELFCEYMSYLVNSNKLPRIKTAGLDNHWVQQNPGTKKWENAYFEDIPDDYDRGITGDWFSGYDEFVDAAVNGNLYGMRPAPKGAVEYDEDWDGTPENNWLTNRQCKKIYKRLKRLTPEKINKIRKELGDFYYIPSDESISKFTDQFGKHVNAGHSLFCSW